MSETNYPPSALKLGSFLKRGNRNPESATSPVFFVDALDVDFKIQGILLATDDTVVQLGGTKYIVGTGPASIPSGITNNMASMTQANIVKGDIVQYNDNIAKWELYFSSDATMAGASGGGIVYSIGNNNFYGFNGTEWDIIGSGITGSTGATGSTGPDGATTSGAGFRYLTSTSLVPDEGGLTYTNDLAHGLTLNNEPVGGGNTDINEIFYPVSGQEASNVTILIQSDQDPSNQLILRTKLKTGQESTERISINNSTTDFLTVYYGQNTFNTTIAGTTCGVLIIPEGRTGATGPTGPTGATGITGGIAGFAYKIDRGVADAKGEVQIEGYSNWVGLDPSARAFSIWPEDLGGSEHDDLLDGFVAFGTNEAFWLRVEDYYNPTQKYIEYRVVGAATEHGDGHYQWTKSQLEPLARTTDVGDPWETGERVNVLLMTLPAGATGAAGTDGTDGASGNDTGFNMKLRGGHTGTKSWWGNTADGGWTFTRHLDGDGNSGDMVYIKAEDIPNGGGATYGNIINLANTPRGPVSGASDYTHVAFGYAVGHMITNIAPRDNAGSLYFYKSNPVYNPPRFTVAGIAKFRKTELWGKDSLHTTTLRLIGVTGTDVYPANETLRLLEDDDILLHAVLDGVTGIGITYAETVDGELFLDYIAADGSTFGRFGTGITGPSGDIGNTGPQGDMNPFNIDYGMTLGVTSGHVPVYGTDYERGEFLYTNRSSVDDAFKLYASKVDSSGVTYQGYLQQASEAATTNTGFATIFSATDPSKFGIFQYGGATELPGAGGDADGLTGTVRFDSVTWKAGSIDLLHTPGQTDQNSDVTAFPVGTAVKFAINQDGQIGNTGYGIGWTYGNEYFVGANAPQSRGDGASFDLGDKWFSSTTGLEFTFLGGGLDWDSDGGVVTGGDEINEAGYRKNVRWVQTNSGRRGRVGPQGAGNTGADGVGFTGATGFVFRGTWTGQGANPGHFSPLDVVRVLRPTSGAAGLGWPSNAMEGLFINDSGGDVWHNNDFLPSPISPWWDVLLLGTSGPTGADGSVGGTGMTGFGFTGMTLDGCNLKVTKINGNGQAIETVTLGYACVTGPTGSTGPIAGSGYQIIHRHPGIDGGDPFPFGTSAIEMEDAGLSPIVGPRAVIANYREQVARETVVVYDSTSKRLRVDGMATNVIAVRLSENDEIRGVTLTDMARQGSVKTIYIYQPSSLSSGVTAQWTANSATDFTTDSNSPGDGEDTPTIRKVYFSDQGNIAAGITLGPRINDMSALHFMTMNVDEATDNAPANIDILVNHVPYYWRS